MNPPTRDIFNLKRFYNDELTSDLKLHVVERMSSPSLLNERASASTKFSEEFDSSSNARIIKTFHVHRLFLAARSEFFFKMFYGCGMKENIAHQVGNQKSEIFFDHPVHIMELFLDYIYTNVCKIDGKTAIPLMALADEFVVDDLKKLCASYVRDEVNLENCCDLLELSSLYNESELCEQCALFIVEHANDIFMTESFLNISQEALVTLLQRQDLSIPEIDIFKAVQRWYKHKKDTIESSNCSLNHINREYSLSSLADIDYVMNFVRLPLIKAHDLLTIVKPSGLISQEKYISLLEYKAYPSAFVDEQLNNVNYKSRASKAQFKWCNYHSSTDFQLSNNGTSVEKTKNSGWNIVMLSDKAFTSGLVSWSISVDKINSDRSGMVIGVVSDTNHPSDGYKSCCGLGMSGYAYNLSKQVNAYGAKQGDHVHIIVDFDRDVITFKLNETIIGTSVKSPSMMKTVYACVFIYFESNKVTAHFGM